MADRLGMAGKSAIVVALIAAVGTYVTSTVIDTDLARREQLSLTLQEIVKIGMQMEEIKRDILVKAYSMPEHEREKFLVDASVIFGAHVESENRTLYRAGRILHNLALQHGNYEAAFEADQN